MAVWNDAVLSTSDSIARFEDNINSLTPSDWDDKISVAKQLIGDYIELELTQRGIRVDEAEGDVLLDVIANPTIFSTSSDYLTLSLIFEDLSKGAEEGMRVVKAKYYFDKYKNKINDDMRRINLDTNLDGEADIRRVNWQGMLSR
jgi:hypothetical protein